MGSDFDAATKRRDKLTTMSFELIPKLGLPTDGNAPENIGFPGRFPYTMGIHARGCRGRLWTINLMPILIRAARARVTQGEMVEELKGEFGVYREQPRI